MNYIQRLFDGAAPATARPAFTPIATAAGAGSSPVLAADQRLGIFPALVDAPLDSPWPPPEAPLPRPSAAIVSPPTETSGVTPLLPPTSPRPRSTSPRVEGAPAQNDFASLAQSDVAAHDPYPKSRLQRLVESEPLPSVSAQAVPSPLSAREPTATAAEAAVRPPDARAADSALQPTATHGAGSLDVPRVAPAGPNVAPVLAAPFQIAPNQFQPRPTPGEPLAPPPAPLPAAAAPDVATRSAPQRLEPSLAAAPSPLARRTEPLPPAPAASRQDQAPPPPSERIIERIREVPVAPAAPPKPMTAAGQSVIGVLAARGAQAWQPRQERL